MRILSIHLDLREEWELCIVCLSCVLFYFSICPRLLIVELIAREAKDFEALVTELLMELHHFIVVLLCQTSVLCYIDDQDTFLPGNQLLERVN